MPQIEYVEGDLFDDVNRELSTVIIPHVCNDKGAWGAGFVIPLANKYPKTRDHYLKWHGIQDEDLRGMDADTLHTGNFGLGQVQFVRVEEQVVVANMVAQTLGGKRPLSYKHLSNCMMLVSRYVDSVQFIRDVHILAPMFGSGLAGGNWNFIEQMIEDHWGNDMTIQINYLPQFLPDNWSPHESGIHVFESRP